MEQPDPIGALLFRHRPGTTYAFEKHHKLHPIAERSPSGTRVLSPQVAWWSRAGRDWTLQLPAVEPPHAVLARGLVQEASCDLTISASRGDVGTVASAVGEGGADGVSGAVAVADEVAAAVVVDVESPGAAALIGRYCSLCDSTRIHGEDLA